MFAKLKTLLRRASERSIESSGIVSANSATCWSCSAKSLATAIEDTLSLITLLLSYAEFDAPVLAKAIFDRTDTAAFRCPVFAGQGMGTAVTLSAQHGGVDPCIDEDLAHCICTPLRQPHISGPLIRTVVPAGNCFIRPAACCKRTFMSDGTSALLVAK